MQSNNNWQIFRIWYAIIVGKLIEWATFPGIRQLLKLSSKCSYHSSFFRNGIFICVLMFELRFRRLEVDF